MEIKNYFNTIYSKLIFLLFKLNLYFSDIDGELNINKLSDVLKPDFQKTKFRYNKSKTFEGSFSNIEKQILYYFKEFNKDLKLEELTIIILDPTENKLTLDDIGDITTLFNDLFILTSSSYFFDDNTSNKLSISVHY